MTEQDYLVHDKEMAAVIYAIEKWRHLLHNSLKLTIRLDNQALKYFKTKKGLEKRQARWAEKLSDLDYTIKHLAGKNNVVADVLS